jgi:osmotically-inducible protein OsmY
MKTDRDLQENVLEELDWEPSLDASHIGVEVRDGVVTLQGKVESYAQKWAAERAAKNVPGVRSLAIELEVSLPGSLKRTDTDIAMAARNAIDWNASIPEDAIKVVVDNGWITLSGNVEWAFMRNAAESAVRGLLGVKGVVNRITITPQIEPRNIKNRIEAALQRRAHVDASHIRIETNKGTVTLLGEVDSLAERDTIEQAAWNAPGVQKVVDNLTVAS